MRVPVVTLWLLLLFYQTPARAQKENNVWVFGQETGLDFNPAAGPQLIRASAWVAEGPASVCDASGRLLFYSDGISVWNSRHERMPEGDSLGGNPSGSATQGAGILQMPGHSGKYYLFTLDGWGTRVARLRYSIIDMALDGGKGDVVIKNEFLATGMSEKMVLASGCGYGWLIVHDLDSPLFYAYRVTAAGIEAPVMSRTYGKTQFQQYNIGELRLSPDQKHLAMASYSRLSSLELFDFDMATGLIRYSCSIDTPAARYGLAFSQDGTKLYNLVLNGVRNAVIQYDLSLLPDSNAVTASQYVIEGLWEGMRRGPDQRLYLSKRSLQTMSDTLSRINFPERAGAACDFEPVVLTWKSPPGKLMLNTRNFGNDAVIPGHAPGTYSHTQDTAICAGVPFVFEGDATRNDFVWQDGVAGRVRTFTAPGTYWCRSTDRCAAFIDTVRIHWVLADTVYHPVKDTLVCFAAQCIIAAPLSDRDYRWSDGTTAATAVFEQSGTKWVYTSQPGMPCRTRVDSFHVSFTRFELAVPDTGICRDGIVALNATVPGADSYVWDDGSANPERIVRQPGSYVVRASIGPCSRADTVQVISKAFVCSLGPDTVVCAGKVFPLRPTGDRETTYLWPDGSDGTVFEINSSGIYTVVATRRGCTETAAVQVEYKTCIDCVRIPNAFTPDGDGRNDLFRPLLSCPVAQGSLIIVNRYGQQVFESRDALSAWDGTFMEQALEVGTYYYLFRFRFDYPGAPEELYKGDVTLLR